jgi:hypothetical protein
MGSVSDRFVEKIKTHILCSAGFFFFQKIEPLEDNVEKYCTAGQATDDNILRRMRFACWIPKATNTHSEYEILLFHCNIGYTNVPCC